MEKLKNFVSRFQVLFKLAAIALLVVMVFAPFIYFSPARTRYDSFWMLTTLFIGLDFSLYDEFLLGLGCFITVIASLLAACLLAISIFWKKLLLFSLFLYLLIFACAIFCAIYFMTIAPLFFGFSPSTIRTPHIAFYVAIILLIADIATLVLMKSRNQRKTRKLRNWKRELKNWKMERTASSRPFFYSSAW